MTTYSKLAAAHIKKKEASTTSHTNPAHFNISLLSYSWKTLVSSSVVSVWENIDSNEKSLTICLINQQTKEADLYRSPHSSWRVLLLLLLIKGHQLKPATNTQMKVMNIHCVHCWCKWWIPKQNQRGRDGTSMLGCKEPSSMLISILTHFLFTLVAHQ